MFVPFKTFSYSQTRTFYLLRLFYKSVFIIDKFIEESQSEKVSNGNYFKKNLEMPDFQNTKTKPFRKYRESASFISK
ncbi:hypothetical protein CHI14_10175 [Paenibacillus sp. 7516]|nr:hypothetical protein CHI14_10175 [Paenibacillus sp. 7516]